MAEQNAIERIVTPAEKREQLKAALNNPTPQAVQDNPELGPILASASATAEKAPSENREAVRQKAANHNLAAYMNGHSVPEPSGATNDAPLLTITPAERSQDKQQDKPGPSEAQATPDSPFYAVEGGKGSIQYRYRDSHKLAFTDRGGEISVNTAKQSAVEGAMQLADSKGWSRVELEGRENFKRVAFEQAEKRSMKVANYEPKPADLEQARQAREARQPSAQAQPARARSADVELG